MEITFANKEDLKSISSIEKTCFLQLETASKEEIAERFLAFPENFLVAKIGIETVGFITGGTTDLKQLPDMFYHDPSLHTPLGKYQTVFSLAVLPNYQKQGIASKLMKSFISLTKQRNKKGVILTCKEPLIVYYQKFGFTCQGISKSVHGNTV